MVKQYKHKNIEKADIPTTDDANSISLPSLSFYSMNRGFFPIWRKIREWGWYKDSHTKAVFIELLLLCNHKENTYLGHPIKPGQCVTGRKKLSVDLGISEQTIRTCLNRLKSTNEITIKKGNKFSIITLNNYFKYSKSTSELTFNQPTTNQQLTTPYNDNNANNDSRESKKYKIKIQYTNSKIPPPQDFVIKYFKELGYPTNEALKYFDHFTANGWKVGGKATMKDWKAAARNWTRRLPQEVKTKVIEPEEEPIRPIYTPEEEAEAERHRVELKRKLGIVVP